MASVLKIDEKLQRISDKSQRKMDRVAIILGLSLLVASFTSYFVLEVYAETELVKLECPKGAYHGLDNQGNQACRDILTNQILEPKSVTIIDSDSGKTTGLDAWIVTDPETGEITLNDEKTSIVEIIIFAIVGIIGSIIAISVKKGRFEIFQRLGWNSTQKEQVRNRQYGKCNMCFTSPTHWKYDHIDGNKKNHDVNNYQGLCPDCFSEKTQRDNQVSIYQK